MFDPDRPSQELQFQGHLDSRPEGSPKFVASIRYHRFDPEILEIQVLGLSDDTGRSLAAQALFQHTHNYVWLHSDDPSVHSVEILGITGTSRVDRHARIDATAIQVGLTRKQVVRYSVRAQLQPSGILGTFSAREHSYTGEMRVKKMIEGRVAIKTAVGELEAADHYGYYSSTEFGDEVTHRVRRPTITGEVTLEAGDSLYNLHEPLLRELDHICLGLSLCYRQPVDYYEVAYMPSGETSRLGAMTEPFFRRKSRHTRRKREDELVVYKALVDDGLQRLLLTPA